MDKLKCYYVIKLPKGGEVFIPANYSRIQEDPTLKELYDKFKDLTATGTQADKESIKEVRAQIREHTKPGLDPLRINSLLEKSTSLTNFVENVNADVDEEVNTDSLLEAINSFIFNKDFFYSDRYAPVEVVKGKTRKYITLGEFYKELTKPVETKYFNQIDLKDVINVNTISSEISNLDRQIYFSIREGLSYGSLQTLRDLMDYTFPRSIRKTPTFFNASFENRINTSIVLDNEETGLPIILYNDSNDLSLFSGVFAYAASKLEDSKLLPILEKFNNNFAEPKISLEDFNTKKFFLGEINEEKYTDPDFGILLSYTSGKQAIDSIIWLVVDSLGVKEADKRGLREGLKSLFAQINPRKFGVKTFGANQIEINEFEQTNAENVKKKLEQDKQQMKMLINEKAINFHYNPRVLTPTEDVDAFREAILGNVELSKDVIIIPKRGTIVPTEINKVRGGLAITGFMTDKTGIKVTDIGVREQIVIKPHDRISYRKLDNTNINEDEFDLYTEEATPLEKQFPEETLMEVETRELKIQGKMVISLTEENDDILPEQFIRGLIKRGSKVTYEYNIRDKKTGVRTGEVGTARGTVKAAFPGQIMLNKNSRTFSPTVSYDKILSFETLYSEVEDDFTEQEWSKKEELLKNLYKITSRSEQTLPIKEGDYVLSIQDGKNRYNKVLAVSNNYVFIMLKTSMKNKNKQFIYKATAIPKESVKALFTKKPSKTLLEEFLKIKDTYLKVYESDGSIRDEEHSFFISYEQAMDNDYFMLDGELFLLTDKEHKYAMRYTEGDFPYVTLKEEDIDRISVYITKRNIAPNDIYTVADINNFRLITADSEDAISQYPVEKKNGFTLNRASYVIPKGNMEQYSLFESGNLNGGTVRFGSKLNTVGEGLIDITKELVESINKIRKTKQQKVGKNLYILQKNNYIQRFNKGLKEFILQDEHGEVNEANYPQKFIDALTESNCYLMYAQKWEGTRVSFSNKLFKIDSIQGDIMTLVYGGINAQGKPIVIKKKESISEAFANKKFKALYVKYNSRTEDLLTKTIEKKTKTQQQLTRQELFSAIADKFKSLFDLETEIRNVDTSLRENEKYRHKRAWIEPGVDISSPPKVVLNLDNENASGTDFVHEYLHLFLISLRYSSEAGSKAYEEILQGYKKDKELKEENPFEIEESLVRYISAHLNKFGILDVEEDFRTVFYNEIIRSLQSFMNENSTIDWKNETSLEDLLHLPMRDIFSTKPDMDEMADANLVFFDSNFRAWVEQALTSEIEGEKLTIECK